MKENNESDKSRMITEYTKALEVEEADKLRGLIKGILNGANIPKLNGKSVE